MLRPVMHRLVSPALCTLSEPAARSVPRGRGDVRPHPPCPARPGQLPDAGKTTDGSDPLDLLHARAAGLCPGCCANWRRRMPPGCRWMNRCWRSICRRKRRSRLVLAYGTLARKVRRRTFCWPAISARSAAISPRAALPVAGLHVDLVRGATELDAVVDGGPGRAVAVAGSGRRAQRLAHRSARRAWHTAEGGARRGTRRLMVAPSCSLLHVPVDLAAGDEARSAR